jgi:hypothetical protein
MGAQTRVSRGKLVRGAVTWRSGGGCFLEGVWPEVQGNTRGGTDVGMRPFLPGRVLCLRSIDVCARLRGLASPERAAECRVRGIAVRW